MKKLILLPLITALFSLVYSVSAAADFVAEDVVIVAIANTNNNEDEFTIWVDNGGKGCGNIHFPRSASPSTEIHKRAYSAALTAFSTGSKVSVYNYKGTDCKNASYIRLVK